MKVPYPFASQPALGEARLGEALVRSWRTEGAFQVAAGELAPEARRAFAASERFFARPAAAKARYVSNLTYAGYAAPGEEAEATEPDRCETFTVCQDIAPDDPRVREYWPCHGPVPWPDAQYRRAMLALADRLGEVADRVLRLVALGLAAEDPDVFARLTWGGWHSLRALRFEPGPAQADRTEAIAAAAARVDDGLLAIVVRPDEAEPLTVLPGVLMQYMTCGLLPPAPRESWPQAAERFAMTYFHAPNFQACVRPLNEASRDDFVHYGTHFTTTYLRRFPARATTLRILAEDRLSVLAGLRQQAARAASLV
ncbi:MAG TPA: 2-oxoglutarate and iron-dependent oxygenase domain-containing protein [Actinocrinis sp.]|uniref:2-oxoglutarate and iron-dependent oxygenase domain-containing protein n=1 Tax=Actinocrinis sp. TaxID=1920516 RepID=UPI002D3507BD|nr:2-oxoglutarate and iron-dependent oxygenase domain-containing protein [Actinocrinis sp.]HZU59262.1 2-oxoglutarate and iron-dependent oxygenase domain-containing protein [Actinocrinis sp.]